MSATGSVTDVTFPSASRCSTGVSIRSGIVVRTLYRVGCRIQLYNHFAPRDSAPGRIWSLSPTDPALARRNQHRDTGATSGKSL